MSSARQNMAGSEQSSSSARPSRRLHVTTRERLALLQRLGYALARNEPTPDPVRHPLFERLRAAFGAIQCLHYRYRTGHALLELRTVLGSPEARRTAAPAPEVKRSMFGNVIQRRAPLVLADLQHSIWAGDTSTKTLGLETAVGIPLVVRGATEGVLAFTWTTPEVIGPGDLKLLRMVAHEVAASVARHHQLLELRERETRVQRADRSQEEFISIVAHELRTPLAPIRHAARILSSMATRDPMLDWCGDVIERQAAQMARIVGDLQDFCRDTPARMALRCDRLDLRRVVSHAVETIAPMLAQQHHQLTIDQPEQPVLVLGDLGRLTQVLSNLLGNAAKYTPPGGHIALSLRQTADHAEVEVQDDGIGIDSDQLTRVFDLFAQVPRPRHRSAEGDGIGLALVRMLVQGHGGEVYAKSAGAGQGSCFVVRLPSLP